MMAIDSGLDRARQSRTHLWLVTITNSFDQQVAERPALKVKFAKYVKDLTAECAPSLFELLKQASVHVTFSGLVGYQVPQMTNFSLPDAVDSAKALLESV